MAGGGGHPTIYDVAAKAGVSIGTVSKALNTPAKVAEPTRRRVLEAVRALDFVPKDVAASRARRGAGRVGVFAPFSSFPSFGERLAGILAAVPGRRAEIVVFDVQSAAESGRVLASLPALRSLDGVIVMSTPIGDEAAAALRHGRLPTVFVDATGFGFPSVTIDDELGGRLAAEALIAAGKTRFAFIGHRQARPDFESASRRRLDGFASALELGGFHLAADRTVLTGPAFDEAAAAASALLASPDPPDAVFAHTDELAAAVHLAAAGLGRAIPGDLALVGFDDSTIARALDITTIRQPLRESGAWALRTLMAMIEDPGAVTPSLTLPVAIVHRGSTR